MERYQNITKKKKVLSMQDATTTTLTCHSKLLIAAAHIRRLEKVNLSNVKTTNFIDKKLQFVQ